VIEAVVERVGPKKEAIGSLDGLLPPDSLLLTNTSSISITDLASATRAPERVCGAHFFTPPRLLKSMVSAGKLGRKTGEGFYEYS
jgi:3-hydroxyacyl-CoA dehydrogenase